MRTLGWADCMIAWPTDAIFRSAFFWLNSFLSSSLRDMGTNVKDSSSLEKSSGTGHVSCPRATDLMWVVISNYSCCCLYYSDLLCLRISLFGSLREIIQFGWCRRPKCCDVSFTIAIGNEEFFAKIFLSLNTYAFTPRLSLHLSYKPLYQ